jgi:FAD/FMN-containing dehydrogenase
LPPLFDFVTPIPYVMLQRMLDESAPWGILGYEKALNLDEFSDGVIDVVVEHFPRKKSPMSLMPVFPLGGVFHDVDDADSAFGGSRSTKWVFNITALAPTPELLDADREWVRAYWDALRPYASGSGSYINFLADADDDRVRTSYGTTKYERLSRIKAAYDPDNVFHLNANIKPAGLPV